ncbi:hypothetical protein JCM10213_005298 [Rhodosporidiobolus nylandii]
MSTIAKTEAHAGSGDLGEGYKAPQNPNPAYEKGKEHSHVNLDSKDEVAAASKAQKEADKNEQHDAYAGAEGNSRGAQIDAELKADDEAALAKKSN